MLRKVVQRQLTRKHGIKNVHSTNVLKMFFLLWKSKQSTVDVQPPLPYKCVLLMSPFN